MIDFHTHTFFSDGVLGPSELVRRAHVKGYRAIGICDHVDGSNIESVAQAIIRAAKAANRFQETLTLPGVEITHAPPGQIAELVREARRMGLALVIVHGESPVEPVAAGTNRAAIEAQADILAHPGHISMEEVELARDRGVALEITSRGGHSLTNGHVARLATTVGAKLVIDTDTHGPGDLITREYARKTLTGAGLTEPQADAVLKNNEDLMEKFRQRLNT